MTKQFSHIIVSALALIAAIGMVSNVWIQVSDVMLIVVGMLAAFGTYYIAGSWQPIPGSKAAEFRFLLACMISASAGAFGFQYYMDIF